MLSYPYTSFLLQNLKNQWLCSSTSALLASVSVQPQTEWLRKTKRAAFQNVTASCSWLPQPSVPGQGPFWHPARGKVRSFAMSHQRRDMPVLRVHPDCSSRGCLMDSVYSSPRLKHSLLRQTWDTSSREWGSTFSRERDSTSSREWGSMTSTGRLWCPVPLCSPHLAPARTPVSLAFHVPRRSSLQDPKPAVLERTTLPTFLVLDAVPFRLVSELVEEKGKSPLNSVGVG